MINELMKNQIETISIVPEQHLFMLRDRKYHLALAQEIKPNTNSFYTAFYKQMAADPNKYVILDNGAAEGVACDIETLMKKAMYIGADEIVLPDKLGDADQTMLMAMESLAWARNFPIKVMGVPQGEDFEEWLFCATQMINLKVDVIGIPKILTKMAGRDARLQALHRLGPALHKVDVHLLGCWDCPLEITLIAKAVQEGTLEWANVRTADSAIAYVHTKGGISLDEDTRPDIKFTLTETVPVDSDLLKKNINMWHTMGDLWRDIEEC